MKYQYPLHKGADGRWIHTWVRQSSIKTSDMCLERWRNDVFNLVSEPMKDASSLGTVCHTVAEDVCNSLIDVNEGHADAPMDLQSAYEAGVAKVANWYDEVFPLLQPLHTEYTFDVPLLEDDQRIVRMTGTVDLVEADRLWDWKFPGRDYSRERWQYERWDVQSIAYCYALGISNFSYAVMHPKGVGRMDFERGQEHFDWLRQKVSALCKLLETQTGPYPLGDNGWWCSDKWCENFARCKGATIGGT